MLAAAACALTAGAPAGATQHLVAPGQDWQQLQNRLRPGDEVILMPGRHLPASFEQIIGLPGQPVTIRSLDPARPVDIDANRDGIRIKVAAHLVIKDLRINNATLSGITIGIVPVSKLDIAELQTSPNITIQNVGVRRVGPEGQRHGIALVAVDRGLIDNCWVEGWGGSAIELVQCRTVTVTRSRFKGLEDHGQLHGVRMRGGCDRITIQLCRFEDAGERVVSFGAGTTDINRHPPPAQPATGRGAAPAAAMLTEVVRSSLEHCQIVNGRIPIAFIHADDCIARNNTIVRPRHAVLAMLIEQKSPHYSPGRRNVFGSNIISWDQGDLKRYAEIDQGADVSSFITEDNLWWSNEPLDRRERLGAIPGKTIGTQIVDIDPKLDEEFKVTMETAAAFGAHR